MVSHLVQGWLWQAVSKNRGSSRAVVSNKRIGIILISGGQHDKVRDQTVCDSFRFSCNIVFYGSCFDVALALLRRIKPITEITEAWRTQSQACVYEVFGLLRELCGSL